MTIVALSGKRKSGKTEAAFEIISIGENLGLKFKKIAFADPLKDEFARAFQIDRTLLDSTLKEEYREQLQAYGQEMRSKDSKYWIKKFFETAKHYDFVVNDDTRYLNELQAMVEAKALIIRIHTDRHIRQQRGWIEDPKIDNHISEVDLDFDITTWRTLGSYIYNNKSKHDLKLELQRELKNLK